GVDPYYLAMCAQRFGYNPEIILAGRRMNDGMGNYVATQTVKLMVKKGINVSHSKIAIFGFTFKENCPDVRNTKVIDIYNSLKEYGIDITVYDPWANVAVAQHEYGIEPVNTLNPEHQFDAVIMAVAHNEFKSIDINAFLKEQSVVYDVKWIINDKVDGKL
ncbi:MAG: nucleotide sugar dehydrogenase, partial [Muribaculaceae bacterium]|nr:nucleotide sugar dehydrogenase [Muribaculaceae bacterium]